MSGLKDEFRRLGQQNRLYAEAARLARLGAWDCDLATEELTWTDGVYDLFGLPLGSRLKRASIASLYVDESRSEMEAARAEAIRSGRGFCLDAQIRPARGDSRWIRISARVAHEDGQSTRIFGAKQDITAEKQAWIRLTQRAELDWLTGLANRAVFDARYREVLGDPSNHGFVSALALIDLDNFKRINDGFGHSTGDDCLRQVGMRLRRIFKHAALVARIGGDEFAVLLRAPLGPAGIARMLQRALCEMSKPIFLNDKRLELGASIGATVLGRPHLRNLSEFFAEADVALYAAKAAGRNTIRLFGDESRDEPALRIGQSRVA
jgi:diguanylate cyclase (GGDEF)-like protein